MKSVNQRGEGAKEDKALTKMQEDAICAVILRSEGDSMTKRYQAVSADSHLELVPESLCGAGKR